MSTEYVKLRGKFKWARTNTPETDPWGNEKWKITLYPDQESMITVMDLQTQGLKNSLRKDEDGYYVTYSRPTTKKIKGKDVAFDPPKVIGPDGKTLEDFIGNNSEGEITLEVYPFSTPGGGKSKAARLLDITVDKLVPYQRDEVKVKRGF